MDFKYLKNILYILILLLYISTFNMQAMAYEDEDLEWTDATEPKLYWGDTKENGDYKIEAIDFPRTDEFTGELTQTPYVKVNIYKNNILVSDTTLYWGGDGDYYVYDGEMKLQLIDIMAPDALEWQNDMYKPWAKIQFELRGLPDMDIDVKPDADSYRAYKSGIKVNISVKNEGDARLHDVELKINTDGLNFIYGGEKTLYTYETIEKDTSIQEISMKLRIPSYMKDTIHNISVEVTGKDEKENPYTFSGHEVLTVLNMINISKLIESEIFMTDTTSVNIHVVNDGTFAVNNIELKDTAPEYFEYIGNTPLEWNFNLGPGGKKDFQYRVKPTKPNKDGYDLKAAAIANWEVSGVAYTQSSIWNLDEIIVHGSKIILEKTVSPTRVNPNGDITVTVKATNVGDVRASVEIIDDEPLPENVTLVSGDRNSQGILEEEDSISFTYVIKPVTDGKYELPKATAKFFDLQGYRSEEISESVVFTAGNVSTDGTTSNPGRTPVPTPTPTPTRETPGFGILSGLAGLALVVFVILRNK
jgi:uncharacterized repeat protein (TIGR01451 family)